MTIRAEILAIGTMSLKTIHKSGFTLLELVIVIAIIGLSVGFIAPRLYMSISPAGMEAAQRQLGNLIQAARSDAITQHKQYFVRFDMDENLCGYYPRQESDGEIPELVAKYKLENGVRFLGVKIPGLPKKDTGTADLTITPDGIVEPAGIYLESNQEKTATLIIKPFSGRFKVYDHYVEEVSSE